MLNIWRVASVCVLLAACANSSPMEEGSPPEEQGRSQPNAIGEIGAMCGGIAGFQCKDETAYCAVEPGVCANTADFAGVCRVKPEMCTMEYAPVCGCDDQPYSNPCAAAVAGVSVAYAGACNSSKG